MVKDPGRVQPVPHLSCSGCCPGCSGTMAQGTYALNSNKGTRERIGRLLLMHANSREDIDVARTGDIVAVAGLKNIITGETLCDEKNPIILERMDVSSLLLERRETPQRAESLQESGLEVVWRRFTTRLLRSCSPLELQHTPLCIDAKQSFRGSAER